MCVFLDEYHILTERTPENISFMHNVFRGCTVMSFLVKTATDVVKIDRGRRFNREQATNTVLQVFRLIRSFSFVVRAGSKKIRPILALSFQPHWEMMWCRF